MKEQLVVTNLSWKPLKSTPPVLKDISESFQKGGFYGVLGPNGSGKTSLIRHILKLLPIKRGQIVLGEKGLEEYARIELAKELAFVPQNTNIDINFTVFDIVAMGRTPYQNRFSDLSKKDIELVEQALQETNCTHLKNSLFHTLSGGEAQRVLVARAIAQDTPWMILDEPISHLDIRHQIELMELLKRFNEQYGKTVIAILHDLNLTSRYCKDVLLMKEGKVFAMGQTEKVLTEENLKEVYGMQFMLMESEGIKYFLPKKVETQ